MRIHADREVCASSGMCALTSPDIFDQDEDDGRVLVLQATPDPSLEADARTAVHVCPSGALSIDED